MNTIEICDCTVTGVSHILPLLESQADIFDYQTKRQIIQKAAKTVETDPQNPPLLLAKHEGIVVGFIGFFIDIENPQLAELFGHIVKKGYQGQGVGRRLLDMGLEKIKNRGANQVELKLKASSPSSVVRFYTKAGFKQSFNEEFTGATDESRTLILPLTVAPATTTLTYPV